MQVLALTLLVGSLVALGDGQDSLPLTVPTFLREPRDVFSAPGRRVPLACQLGLLNTASRQQSRLRDSQRAYFAWSLNGTMLTSSRLKDFVLSTSMDLSQLIITNYRPLLHQGRYQCHANFSTGNLLSRPAYVRSAIASLNVEQSPAEDIAVTLTVGNTAFISCVSPFNVSVPKAEVVDFELNGMPLTLTPRHFVTTEGNLLIAPVQPADQGSYRCLVANVLLDLARLSTVNVLRVLDPKKDKDGPAPRHLVLKTPQNEVSTILGQNVSIECVFVGMPPPRTVWEFARPGDIQRQVTPSADGRVSILSGALQITNVQASDAGLYSCSSIDSRSIPHYSQLTVHKMPLFDSDASSFQLVNARVGSKLELECGASDATRFSWYQEGVLLLSSGQSANRMVINVVTPQNDGLYQCIAENAYGSASKTIKVTVANSKNTFQIVQVLPSNISISVDEFAVFACVASEDLKDGTKNWVWLKDGRSLANDSRILIEEPNDVTTSLQIFNVKASDAGSYSCVLLDSAGSRSARATAWLTVESAAAEANARLPSEGTTMRPPTRRTRAPKRRPTTPDAGSTELASARTEIYIVVLNSSSVLVRWAHAEPVVRWLHGTAVSYRTLNATDSQNERKFVTAEVSQFVLGGLLPDTLYEIWVVAQQQNGDRASPSDTVLVRTPPSTADRSLDDYALYDDDEFADAEPPVAMATPASVSAASSAGLLSVRQQLPDASERPPTDSTLLAVLVSAACGTLLLLGIIVALLLTRARRYRRTKADGADTPTLHREAERYAKLPQHGPGTTVSPLRPQPYIQIASECAPMNAEYVQSSMSSSPQRAESYAFGAEEMTEVPSPGHNTNPSFANLPLFVPSLVTKRGSLLMQNVAGNTLHLVTPFPYAESTTSGPECLTLTQSAAQPCNIVSLLSNIRPPSVTNSTVSSQPAVKPHPVLGLPPLGPFALETATASAASSQSSPSPSPSASSVVSSSDCDCSQDSHCRAPRKSPRLQMRRNGNGNGHSSNTASRKRKHARYRNASSSGTARRSDGNGNDLCLTLTHSTFNGALAAHLDVV